MVKVKNGTTRIVFLILGYAIKIPNFKVEHHHFLLGCAANWNERKLTKLFKGCTECEYYNKINPTLFSSWLGLLSIQREVELLDRNLTTFEVEYFKDQTSDIKKSNFGYLGNRLVCIDYS